MRKSDADAVNQQLQGAYHATFTSPQGKIVVADLIAFCFGRKSTFDPNERVQSRNDGRREVLLRISEFTNLTLEEIYALRGPVVRNTAQQEDTGD